MARAVLLLSLLLPAKVFANEVDLGVLDQIQEQLEISSDRWREKLKIFARNLLLLLMAISLAWQGILMTLRGSDLTELLTEVARIILYGGFFLATIQYSAVWCEAAIESFSLAAAQAGGIETANVSIGPADTFRKGVKTAFILFEAEWGLFDKLSVGILSLVLVLIYAVIAGYQLLVLSEMYIATTAGIILLGFGGASFSRDTAIRHLWYVLSVGAKLYALYLIVGLGDAFVHQTINNKLGKADVVALIGMVFMLAVLTITIPRIIQGMVNGSTVSFGREQAGVGKAVPVGVGGSDQGAAPAVAASAMSQVWTVPTPPAYAQAEAADGVQVVQSPQQTARRPQRELPPPPHQKLSEHKPLTRTQKAALNG